jgi:cobalt-zinc-cadmium efflux system outer membrane protein
MRRWFTVAATVGALCAQAASGQSLTLAEAIRRAEAANANVLGRQAQESAIAGALTEAEAFLYNNPTLSVEGTRRSAESTDAKTNEFNVVFSQAFETGAQQTNRRSAASYAMLANDAEIDEARRNARAEAALHFFAVLTGQQRVSIEQRSVNTFDNIASIVAKRRAAGEDTRLDANLAVIEAERARNALGIARERLVEARSELASTLQLPPEILPDVAGSQDAASVSSLPYTLDQLLASLADQPRHRALVAKSEAARSRLAVERGNRNPDVTVGLSYGREGFSGERERLARLWVSVPLPLFKRNDAAVGQATSELTQAELDRTIALRDTSAKVRRLWSALQSQSERVQRLNAIVLPASSDNQQLSAKSRQAGQIGVLDQLTVTRQALEAERELNEAIGEYQATRIELERSSGWQRIGGSQ